MKSFVLFAIASFFGFQGGARELVSSLPAPPHWKWQLTATDNEYVFNLTNLTNGSVSPIRYAWAKTGERLDEQAFDQQNFLIAPKPGRHLWQSYPGAVKTEEEFFIDILKNSGFDLPVIPYITEDARGITVSTIDDFLAAAEKVGTKEKFDSFYKELTQQLRETRIKIASSVFPLDDDTRKVLSSQVLDRLDPVQAVYSGVGDHGNHFGAFNLLVVDTVRDRIAEIMMALREASQLKEFNPILFDIQFKKYKESVRNTVIALVSNNHFAGRYFVKAVLLKGGPRMAWEATQYISQLYKLERDFWTQDSVQKKGWVASRRDDSLVHRIELSGFAPIDNTVPLVVNLKVLSDLCPDLKTAAPPENMGWVPLHKTYHMYGAYLVAKRVSQFFSFPNVEKINIGIGLTYKHLNNVSDQNALNLMSDLYSAGAWYGFYCE